MATEQPSWREMIYALIIFICLVVAIVVAMEASLIDGKPVEQTTLTSIVKDTRTWWKTTEPDKK